MNLTDDKRIEFTAEDKLIYLWPSDILEYLYCPRFIYYERVLKIPQHEELRYKVMLGRKLHEMRSVRDRDYLRKRLGVQEKLVEVELASAELHLKGIVDEVLFFSDGRAAPLDYKFAEWKGRVYRPLFYQSMIYAVLIEELFSKPVPRGYIVYTRSSNHIEVIEYPHDKRKWVERMVSRVLEVIIDSVYPSVKANKSQCADCTYAKLCIK